MKINVLAYEALRITRIFKRLMPRVFKVTVFGLDFLYYSSFKKRFIV